MLLNEREVFKIKDTFTINEVIKTLRKIYFKFENIITGEGYGEKLHLPKNSIYHLVPDNTETMVDIIQRTVFVISPSDNLENGVTLNLARLKRQLEFCSHLQKIFQDDTLEITLNTELSSDSIIKLLSSEFEKYVKSLNNIQ